MSTYSLQDEFIGKAMEQGITITVFLANGFQLKGLIKGFDKFTIIMDCEGRQTLIYKHSISTIIPTKSINIDF